MKTKTILLVMFAMIAGKAQAQDTIAVDSAIHYQIIKGWGETGGTNTQFEGTPPYLVNQIINESVDGMGLNGLRYECFQGSYSQTYGMCRTWEWQNDNGSPDTTNGTAFDTTSVDYYMTNYFIPYKNKVIAAGLPFTFYESPSWYFNGSTGDIPAFLRNSPGEYAEYLISNLLYLKNKYGITADYLTVCNEAGNNNQFTANLVDTMIRTVGVRLRQAGLPTMIQFPECVSVQTSWTYIQALQNDTVVWPYIKCLSYHLYGADDPYRADMATLANTLGIVTAQTEEIGNGISELFDDLLKANVSYYDLYGNGDYMPLNANLTWFTHGAKYWTLQQITHRVKPGSVRIGATSNDTTVRVVAFNSGGNITVSMLNTNNLSSTHPVTITGLPPGNYGVSQTLGVGTYSEIGVVTVPLSGILTVTITNQSELAIYPHPFNVPPVATNWAANPTYQELTVGTSVALSATAIDPQLSTVTYHWAVDSFPIGATVVLSNPGIANPTASGMTVAGNYVFSVSMSNSTDSISKSVTVPVFANNQAPFIETLQSRVPVLITLPIDTTVIQGFAFDMEGDAITYLYTIVNQPIGANAILSSPNTNVTHVTNMTVPGDYVFKLSVSDPTHTTSRNITVTVYQTDRAPVITSVSANPRTTNTSADSSQLSAITSDPDTDIITHWWTIESVPAGANPVFTAQGERITEVNNLSVPGIYVFKLYVIDRTKYTTMNDTVIVNTSTGIENSLSNDGILVYPNPVTEELHIQLLNNNDKLSKMILSNAIGQEVLIGNKEQMNSCNLTIALKFLPAGIYLLSMQTQDNIIVRKIIKQ